MVVSFISGTPNARALQSLLFLEGSENAKDDRHASVELYAHERLRDALADVLEVHSCALDEHTDRDHRVERSAVLGARRARARRCAAAGYRRGRAWRADVWPTQQIYGGCTGLDMGSGDHSWAGVVNWLAEKRVYVLTAGKPGGARNCLGQSG